jgi:hypothetical protein
LVNGAFERGGRALRMKDGTEIAGLTVQRSDTLAAISILKAQGRRGPALRPPQEIVMVRRRDFSTFGSVSSSTPSFIDALAFASSTSAGRGRVRVNALREISAR